MKVICIENEPSTPRNNLIIGKQYDVLHYIFDIESGPIIYSEYCIKGEYGFEHYYPTTMFIRIEENRENKLNQLGI